MTEATKTFLAIYLGSPAAMEAWRSKSEAERKALQAKGMAAWKAWADKQKDAIAAGGAPLGKTKRVTAAASPTSATRWPPIRSFAPLLTRPLLRVQGPPALHDVSRRSDRGHGVLADPRYVRREAATGRRVEATCSPTRRLRAPSCRARSEAQGGAIAGSRVNVGLEIVRSQPYSRLRNSAGPSLPRAVQSAHGDALPQKSKTTMTSRRGVRS